jgi:hypothetical protein
MMTKTVIIPDDIHILIIKKQVEIREKYGVNPRITDMLVAYIKDGLERTEELLNIKTGDMGVAQSKSPRISLIEQSEVRT